VLRRGESGRSRTRFRCDPEQHSGLKVNADSGGKANGFLSPSGMAFGLEWNVFYRQTAGG
jgi:hypothetical protein